MDLAVAGGSYVSLLSGIGLLNLLFVLFVGTLAEILAADEAVRADQVAGQ
jgi:hypothetical protein